MYFRDAIEYEIDRKLNIYAVGHWFRMAACSISNRQVVNKTLPERKVFLPDTYVKPALSKSHKAYALAPTMK